MPAKRAAAAKAPSKKRLSKRAPRKKAAASVGLAATECRSEITPELAPVAERVEKEGGCVLAACRDPLGGHATMLATLPIDRIQPTPFQRDLSETHHKRLAELIQRIGAWERAVRPSFSKRTRESEDMGGKSSDPARTNTGVNTFIQFVNEAVQSPAEKPAEKPPPARSQDARSLKRSSRNRKRQRSAQGS